MTTRNHKYGLGDMAEACKNCGLEFSAAHSNDLPCTGQYSNPDHQVLYDIGAKGDYDDRIARYISGVYPNVQIRPEVFSIAVKYLGTKLPRHTPTM